MKCIKSTSDFKKKFGKINDEETIYKKMDKNKFDVKISEFENIFKVNKERKTNIRIIINIHKSNKILKMDLTNIRMKFQENRDSIKLIDTVFRLKSDNSKNQILKDSIKCCGYDIYQENKYDISKIIEVIKKIY